MKHLYLIILIGFGLAAALAETMVVPGSLRVGIEITGPISGENILADTINSNKLDAATRAMLGTGSGSITTNTPSAGQMIYATSPSTAKWDAAPTGSGLTNIYDTVDGVEVVSKIKFEGDASYIDSYGSGFLFAPEASQNVFLGSDTFGNGIITSGGYFTNELQLGTALIDNWSDVTNYFNTALGVTNATLRSLYTNNAAGLTNIALAGVNGLTNALTWLTNNAGGATTFLGLSDTPAIYEDKGGKILIVADAENGVSFATVAPKSMATNNSASAGQVLKYVDENTFTWAADDTGGGGGGTNSGPITLTLSGTNVALSAATPVGCVTNAVIPYRLTMTTNALIQNPTDALDGQQIKIEFLQDATGNRAVYWDTKFAGGSDLPMVSAVLTTNANARDFIKWEYNAVADKWYFLGILKGY